MLNVSEVRSHIPAPGAKYDVIVAGGGPAGFGAAMAAAKTGAKVLLLEARSFFGGVAGTSLWMPINRLMIRGGTRGGIHEMLVSKLRSYGQFGARTGKTTWTDGDGLHTHPDYLKLAMMELLEEAGCDYRLDSPIVGAIVENGVVKGVEVGTKSGKDLFYGDVMIDCTGDGDLSAYAGAEIQVGGEEDGKLMPVTLGFSLANVDYDKLYSFFDEQNAEESMYPTIERAEKAGYTVAPWYSFDRTTVPGVISVNNGGLKNVGRLYAADPADATLAERAGIQIAIDFVRFAREFRLPGLEDCYLDRTGAAIGVRETRRVMCDYVLTMDDAKSDADFPDPIAMRYGAVDQAGLNADDAAEKPTMRSGHTFPYRALLVKGLEGLLVAGRCGSYTHMALAAGKSMGNMMAIGQAAGVAAARASALGVTPRQLPYEEVKAGLQALNVAVGSGGDW